MCCLSSHHTELVLVDEGDQILNLLFQRGLLDVLLCIWVGRLVARVSVAEGHG